MSFLSEPSRKRLVNLEYLLLQDLQNAKENSEDDKKEIITSRELSQRTGWTDATIRRDISALGIKCSAKRGYNIKSLYEGIREALISGVSKTTHKCCIVGLGKIGTALLDYNGFLDAGFSIVAGFDESVNRVEILNASFPLYPASKLEQIIQQELIEYAVLTVPEKDANNYSTRLVQAGILGIVNYTSTVLNLPKNVAVENVSLASSLHHLLSKRVET